MKIFIFIFVLTIGSTLNSHAAFGRIAAEKERRLAVEQKLTIEQQTTTRLKSATAILGVGCIAMLVLGAAIGSKGRRNG